MENHRSLSIELLTRLGMLGKYAETKLPSFKQFVSDMPEMFFKFLEVTTGSASNMSTVASLEYLYPLTIAHVFGSPQFRLSRDLLILLRDTEVPDVPAELLRLPFPGIILEIPAGTFMKPAHSVTSILIASSKYDERFRVAYDTGDDNAHFTNFLYNAADTLHGCLRATHMQRAVMDPVIKAEFPDFGKEDIFDDYYRADVFRLALNACLYIACGDADVQRDKREISELHDKLQGLKQGARREHLESLLRKAKQRQVYIVGGGVKLAREYEAAQGDRKLLVRFRVRGHFRNQACGEGRLERRLTWIAPHWKGPTYAEMVEKGYLVK
jgi:hypothetical protein